MAVTKGVGHKARTRVTSKVNCEACLDAKACADTELRSICQKLPFWEIFALWGKNCGMRQGQDTYHQEEKSQREPCTACNELTLVGVVLEGEDHEDKECGGDELVEKLVHFANALSWVRSEDSGSRSGRGSDSKTWVVCVDQAVVVCVDDTSSCESSEGLSDEIHWQASPWQLAEHTTGESNGRATICGQLGLEAHKDDRDSLQVCSTVTGDVDTQHEADTESPVNALPVAKSDTTWPGSICLPQGDLS